MGFSAKQVQALRRNPDHRHVRTRSANGRQLSYIEGWYAISEANRIFGFDAWSRETVEIPLRAQPRESWRFPGDLYRPKVRITVASRRDEDHPRRPWHRRRPRDLTW